MAKNHSKHLFELIRSMSRSEKRYFTMLSSLSGEPEDKKMLQLFNALNKMEGFDEKSLYKDLVDLRPEQLANLKSYTYKKIMQSLRAFHVHHLLEIQVREQVDFALILFERRLYQQGLACLRRARKLASRQDLPEIQLEIIKLEKSVMMHTIGESDLLEKVDAIIDEVRGLNNRIHNLNMFSNLQIKLNSLYTKIGFIRDETDQQLVLSYFKDTLPPYREEELSFNEKAQLYRLYIGLHFFLQDFEVGYAYATKLIALFEEHQDKLPYQMEPYIQGINQLLIAQFKLYRFAEFVETNHKLHNLSEEWKGNLNERMRLQLKKYYYIHEINRYFLTGEFDEGIRKLLQDQSEELQSLIDELDHHSAMILTYKVACLYLGASNYNQTLKWLNRIVNIPNADIREDLHCFARIINLICHFELGNFDVISHYIISTYRFLLKKEDLHLFQKNILKFLKNLRYDLELSELDQRFASLKAQLLPLVDSAYEKRAFIYFDIISWLESKIEHRPVQAIIQEKARLKVGELKA